MRVAIVGSGISGLSACWMLKQHSDHEVNMYEKASVAGGDAQTVEFRRDGKEDCTVDTGFMAFNPAASPNLLRFLKLLGIPLTKVDMSLAVSGEVVWSTNRAGLSLQNILNPRAWRTAWDATRFACFAPDVLRAPDGMDITLSTYLEREKYSRGFFEDFLLPLITALWLVPDDLTALNMPAAAVVRGLRDNEMLAFTAKPQWMSIEGGAKTFTNAMASVLPPYNLHLNTEIVSITSHDYGVRLVEASGANHVYDHVILAIHSDTALALLQRGGWASPDEEKALRGVTWHSIEAELHGEPAPLNGDADAGPSAQQVFATKPTAAIQYLATPAPPAYDTSAPASKLHVSLTYSMNALHHLSLARHGPVLLTVNPTSPPANGDDESALTHPEAQRWRTSAPLPAVHTDDTVSLAEIQNTRRVAYAGAWAGTGLGRAEDAVTSAYALVTREPFGADRPFALEGGEGERSERERTQTPEAETTPDTTPETTPEPQTQPTPSRTPSPPPIPAPAPASRATRLAVATGECTRRALAPAWPLLAWPVVLALLATEWGVRLSPLPLLFGRAGARRVRKSLRDLRACWVKSA